MPKEPIHPPVKAKKKSPSPEPKHFNAAKKDPTPKKVIATPTMKEKQDQLQEYKQKKATAEQMLLISNPQTSIAKASERQAAPVRKIEPEPVIQQKQETQLPMESDSGNAYEEEEEDVYSEEERAASSKVVSEKVKPDSPPVADRYEANLSPEGDYDGEESSAKPSAQASAAPSKLQNADSKMESSKAISQRQPPAVQSQDAKSVADDEPDYSDEDEYKDDE